MSAPDSLEAFVHDAGIRGQIQLAGSPTARRRTLAGIAVFVALVLIARQFDDLNTITGLYAASFLALVGTAAAAVGLINHPVPFELTDMGLSINEQLTPWRRIRGVEVTWEDEPPPGVLTLVLTLDDGVQRWGVSPFQHPPEDIQWLAEAIEERC